MAAVRYLKKDSTIGKICLLIFDFCVMQNNEELLITYSENN